MPAAADAGTIYSSIRFKLDQFQKDLSTIKSKMNTFVTQSQNNSNKFGSFWKNAFQTAFGVGIQKIMTNLFASVRNGIAVFSGFQQSMRNVQSVTGAIGSDFQDMSDAAKEAGETTRFTAREAADALYYLGSAGFSAKQSIAALDGVLQLAGATQSDLAFTAENVASIISQYNLAASDAGKVSNILAAAIGNSQATMEKLSNAFRQVGPVAAGFGISLEQTTGALQELFNAGFLGQQAGRALKSALADLASPTTNLRNIMKKLGVELSKVNPETNDLADIIDTLAESGATTADIIDAFGKVAGPQMATLIKQGGDALRQYTEDVTGTQAASKAYETQNDSLAGSLDFLNSKIESFNISVIEKAEPGMRDLIDAFIKFLDAAQPVGEAIGIIINALLKIATLSVGAVTSVFNSIFSQFREGKEPMEQAADAMDKVTKSIKRAEELGTTAGKINRLTEEYENLRSKTNLTESEQNRLKSVISQLENIVPGAITRFDEYGNAIEISGEKSREAAKQMLIAREAALEQSKAELEASKAIYQRILRTDKLAYQNAKNSRNRLIAESTVGEARIALLETFQKRFLSLTSGGMDQIEAYIKLNEELGEKLRAVGIEFPKLIGGRASIGRPFRIINDTIEESNRLIDELQKSVAKPTDVEIRFEDARKKLEELAELEKQIKTIQNQINDLDKIEPADKKSTEQISELDRLLNAFWKTYNDEINKATLEASTFGEQQDVLRSRLDFLKRAYLDLIEKGVDPASKTMTKLKTEYSETLNILNELTESEKKQKEELEKAKQTYESITSIIDNYKKKNEEIGKSNDELIELERKRAIETVLAMNATVEATNEAVDAINTYYDNLKQNSEDAKEDFRKLSDEILASASQLTDSLASLFNQQTQNRIDELDRQLQAQLEAAGLSEETEQERLEKELQAAIEKGDEENAAKIRNDIERLKIEKDFEKKKAMVQYEGALVEWRLKLLAATADLAKAILTATAAAPFPFNLPAIAYATAQGANVATIAISKPQPPKFETGGISTGPAGGYDVTLHGTEAVLNARQMKNVFDMIDRGNTTSTGSNEKMNVTVIYQVDGIEIARTTAEVYNNGIVTLEPDRALRK